MKSQSLLSLLAAGSLFMACASLAADYEKSVNDLIPRLAAQNVGDRYAAWMDLQDLATSSGKPGAGADRLAAAKAISAKAADATTPQPARVYLVRQLEYIGREESVAILTKLLTDNDAELRETARRALQKNPASAAGASLRAALEQGGDANWQIGLVSALGNRADAAAVSLIVTRLADAKVAPFAALALGQIATPDAVAALWTQLNKLAAAGDALINAANTMLSKGNATAAAVIYGRVLDQAELPALKGAALVGLAKADPAPAMPMIGSALVGADVRLQNAAIRAAQQGGKGLSAQLATLLPTLKPAVKVQVLGALDASAEKAVIEAVKDADETVRVAAYDALGRIGSGVAVPVLLSAAAGEARAEKTAAESALIKASGESVTAAIQQAAIGGDTKTRVAAINAVAARKQAAFLPSLLKMAGEPDIAVQKAAFAALGKLGADSEVEIVARMALATKSATAYSALEGIASRVKDKAAASRKIMALAGNDSAAIASLLDSLGALGGDEALQAVARLAAGTNAELKDAAIRVLGNWPDFAAVKQLQPIAANPNTPLNHYQVALQGMVRLVKVSETEPAPARMEAALAAMESARRDEDKKLALSAIGAVPHPKAVEVLKPLFTDPKFKQEAGQAALSLAELLMNTERKAARDLATAVKEANISEDLNRRANRLAR